MPARHDARVHLDCPAELRDVVQRAVATELAEGPAGTQATLVASKTGLELHIEADDLSGLRAACNNLVRLVDVAIRAAA